MQPLKALSQYKNKMVNIGIIILALIITYNIHQSQNKTLETLKAQKDATVKKNTVLGDLNKLEQSLIGYKSYLNRKDVSAALNTLNALASESGVNIILIRPGTEKSYREYIKYFFDVSIEAGSYHAIARFISKIESHPDIYILEAMGIAQGAGTQRGIQPNKLAADLKISTLLFKD